MADRYETEELIKRLRPKVVIILTCDVHGYSETFAVWRDGRTIYYCRENSDGSYDIDDADELPEALVQIMSTLK